MQESRLEAHRPELPGTDDNPGRPLWSEQEARRVTVADAGGSRLGGARATSERVELASVRAQGPRRAIRRAFAFAGLAITSIVGTIGVTPDEASAYTNTLRPENAGPTSFQGGGGQIVSTSNYNFATPPLFVYRNGTIAGQQHITVLYELQRSAGGSPWNTVAAMAVEADTGFGADPAVIPSTPLRSPYSGSAWFRVRTSVLWGGDSFRSPYLYNGAQQWVPSQVGDMRCAQLKCNATTAGMLWVWG